jgi:hypothetical protein
VKTAAVDFNEANGRQLKASQSFKIANSDSNAPGEWTQQMLVKLFALRAGVHVDFHANQHFNDLRCFPGHLANP